MERTLVVHSGGIGDLLLAAPAVEMLAKRSSVALAGIPERGALLQEAGLVEAVYSLDDMSFASIFGTPAPRFLQFARQFDRVVVWMRDPDGRIQRAFRTAGVQQVEVYPGLPPDAYTGHAAAYYCECLSFEPPTTWRLPCPARASHASNRCLIHPGSGSTTKNWPMENYRALARSLAATGWHLEWIWGPAEREWLAEAEPLPPLQDLNSLAQRLGEAELYVGNDSGITHLASVMGAPTAAIFGPTNPLRWHPIGPRTSVIAHSPFPSPEAVLEGIQTLLAPTSNRKTLSSPRE